MASCSSDEPAMESDVANNDGWKKATLNFHPELSQTDTRSGEKKSSEYKPNDKDVMAIEFFEPNGFGMNLQSGWGYAIYNSSEDIWDLYYNVDLEKSEVTTDCHILYIENNPEIQDDPKKILCDYNNATYICEDAKCGYNPTTGITLTAVLHPNCCRIRFQGEKESSFEFNGFNSYTGIDLTEGVMPSIETCTLHADIISGDEGFTSPYYYVDPKTCTNLRIKENDMVYVWNKAIELHSGKSGLIQLPALDPDNWASDIYKTKEVAYLQTSHYGSSSWFDELKTSSYFESLTGISYKFHINYRGMYDTADIYAIVNAWDDDSWNNNEPLKTCIIDLKVGEQADVSGWWYVPSATKYTIEMAIVDISVDIYDLQISNF